MSPTSGLERLGVNLLYLVPGRVGGSEVYARELLSALHRLEPGIELIVYCGPEAAPELAATDWGAAATLRPAPGPSNSKPLRAVIEQTWLPLRARADEIQLLHSLGTTAPMFAGVRSVVTVLDLIFHHVPSTFPPLSRAGLELIVPRAARRADAVIAISEYGRGDIAATIGIARDTIFVTHLGFGLSPVGARLASPEPGLRRRLDLGESEVVLCVSALLAHKNLARLIDAFATIATERDAILVIAGHQGLAKDSLVARAAGEGIGDRVRITGWIERSDLEALYGIARLFAYPSLIEGFGMPILEAMARGVPVASSNAGALVEVGGRAAEFFDPRDTAQIALAITRLLDDEDRRGELVALGHQRAREFTWERCAASTLDVYGHGLRRSGRRGAHGRGTLGGPD
jgi:glycosyltransferase involved in cell wall biosynthesis